MGLNAAALRLLAEKGLTAADIVELAEVLEVRKDPTAAERMRRHRARKASEADGVTVTRHVTGVTDKHPPNEYISNPPVSPSDAKASQPPKLCERVVSAWNEGPAARGATKARPLDAGRRKALSSRVREHGEEAVFTAIRNTAASDWHCGKNDRDWRANVGWLLKSPENFVKMLEREPAPAPSSAPAKPLDPDHERKWREHCREQLELAEATGRTKDAEYWRERGGFEKRRTATGPPRSVGDLVAGMVAH